ncbi:MAG: polymer-forming cytoskeletal protein [Halioglobus sp.]|nr:polymer-forming cytoskeletal protein [Halioglobus sp.]
MLKKSWTGGSVSGATTLISADTTILGEVRFSGNLDVEGRVRGDILAEPGADAMIRVVEGARVEGDIRAPLVLVNGLVEGDVYASSQLELAPKGRVEGDVYYAMVEMSVGSEVNGSLTHVPGDELEQAAAAVLDGS